jgi:glycosyltransferase involved in cell wall biosynthesis
MLAQKTFKPYKANEMISGLGVSEPPSSKDTQLKAIYSLFPDFKNKKVLLYLGRFHPKKGVDLLINSFLKQSKKNDILLLAGPLDNADPHLKYLKEQTHKNSNQIVWSGMLKDDLKWGALRMADALILPSHQENFGMVIAEALSVETPVFLTNKVNLWREVLDSGAGIVSDDDQGGIDHLIQQWVTDVHYECLENASKCFREKLHISQTVEKIISIFPK